MADMFDNMTVDSLEQLDSPSPAAQRNIELQGIQKQTTGLPKFFEDRRQQDAIRNEVSKARSTTANMKQAISLQNKNFDNALKYKRQLANIDQGAANTLLETETQFRLDATGRKILSERQLTDWYLTRTKKEEDWNNFQARQSQLHERKIRLLEHAYKVLQQAEKNAYAKGALKLDQETRKFIAERKAEMREKIAEAERDAANKSALAGALGTIGSVAGGAVAGYFSGGNSAAVAGGAAAGGALGTWIGTQIG